MLSYTMRGSTLANYSLEQKLAGEDLHGLPCRIPKPTLAQAKCSHTEEVIVDYGYENWGGEWQSDRRREQKSIEHDIPGTNNTRCSRCGYTRRY